MPQLLKNYWVTLVLAGLLVIGGGKLAPYIPDWPDWVPTPGPVDPVNPSPVETKEPHVLVVYESEQGYPQQMANEDVVTYLNAICPKVEGTPQWRVYDQNVSMEKDQEIWRKAMSRPHPTLPWIGIYNGNRWTEEALPADPLPLLKKYGGT